MTELLQESFEAGEERRSLEQVGRQALGGASYRAPRQQGEFDGVTYLTVGLVDPGAIAKINQPDRAFDGQVTVMPGSEEALGDAF